MNYIRRAISQASRALRASRSRAPHILLAQCSQVAVDRVSAVVSYPSARVVRGSGQTAAPRQEPRSSESTWAPSGPEVTPIAWEPDATPEVADGAKAPPVLALVRLARTPRGGTHVTCHQPSPARHDGPAPGRSAPRAASGRWSARRRPPRPSPRATPCRRTAVKLCHLAAQAVRLTGVPSSGSPGGRAHWDWPTGRLHSHMSWSANVGYSSRRSDSSRPSSTAGGSGTSSGGQTWSPCLMM